MGRVALEEREVSATQSAFDRKNGAGWDVWTNDSYWHRRFLAIGAEVVSRDGDGATYRLSQKMLLFRKVPQPRQGPRLIQFLQHKQSKAQRQVLHSEPDIPPS